MTDTFNILKRLFDRLNISKPDTELEQSFKRLSDCVSNGDQPAEGQKYQDDNASASTKNPMEDQNPAHK